MKLFGPTLFVLVLLGSIASRFLEIKRRDGLPTGILDQVSFIFVALVVAMLVAAWHEMNENEKS